MLRFLFLRVILPLLLFLVVRYVIKAVLSSRTSQASSASPSAGELKKDPVCGTYVSPGTAVAKSVRGKTVYFCSNACRDRYVA